MSLPEKPLTRREVYLAKAAGQDVTLPEEDITREEQYLRAIAEGGGGGVTPEYVAEAIAEAKTDIEAEIPTKTSDLTNDSGYAAIDDTTAAQNKAYSSAKVEEKVAGEEITTTDTGTDLTLSTSSGSLNALTVYGKSEVINGAIVSAGEGHAVVDLGTLTWVAGGTNIFAASVPALKTATSGSSPLMCPRYQTKNISNTDMGDQSIWQYYNTSNIRIHDSNYNDVQSFSQSLNGVILAYKQVTPTDNAIAVKTDDGTGINGTMATFSTGTPLRDIPDTDVRDVMAWDGSAGTVTKNCAKVKASTLIWSWNNQYEIWQSNSLINLIKTSDNDVLQSFILTPLEYTGVNWRAFGYADKTYSVNIVGTIGFKDSNYDSNTQPDFDIIYELATPTTEQLTTAENDSIAGLRTFTPQTHAQNNAGATMTVEAYAGTANGQAVQELKQDVQSEISALKITQSDTLTLTVVGWSSNQQTVTYAHDTAKRNVIDVDPSSIEEWASCGILATAETASGITFTCKTVPENALTFRVTSMGVN